MKPSIASVNQMACANPDFLIVIGDSQYELITSSQLISLKIFSIKTVLFILLTCICINTYAQSNYALSFDGTDDYVSTSAYVIPTSGNFTVEFWVNATNYSGYQEFVSQGSSGSAFYIGVINSTGVIRCGDNWGATGVTMPLNKWVHIALVKSGGSATLYLDGIQKATLASGYSISSAGSNFQMATQYGGFGEYFNGKLDELRVWNVARTQAEIKANLFNKNLSNSASGLTAYYRMNNGSGTTATNSCTNTSGIDGTLTNGPTWTVSPVQYAGNALHFDQANDRVLAPLATTATSNVTMELWLYHEGGTGTDHLLMVNGVMGTNGYAMYINTQRKLCVQFNGVGTWNTNVVLSSNQWTHLALVITTTGFIVYQNGVNVYSNTATPITPTTNVILGFNTVANGQPFDGMMDEVRIWNTARTQTEIQNNINGEIAPSTSGLALYYTFNQGITAGDNTGLATLIDETGNNNGTVTNFSLSGATSNYVTQNSGIITLPLKWLSFTAQKREETVLLQWSTASEINTKNFLVEHSFNSNNWQQLYSLQSAGNSNNERSYSYVHEVPVVGMNYYRIKQIDIDGNYSYSGIRSIRVKNNEQSFKVLGNPLVTGKLRVQISQPNNLWLKLFSNDGGLIWSKEFATGTHTLNLSELPKGTYVLQSGHYSEKILLQ